MYKKCFIIGFFWFCIDLQALPANLVKPPLQKTRTSRPKKKKRQKRKAANKKIRIRSKILIGSVALGSFIIWLKCTSSSAQAEALLIDCPPEAIPYKVSDAQYRQALKRAWDKFPQARGAYNEAGDFVGIQGMAERLFDQLEQFESWYQAGNRKAFQGHHYDWWVFPNPYLSKGYGTKYAVYEKDIEALQGYVYEGAKSKYKDRSYPEAQRRATELVLWAAGWWDCKTQSMTGKCHHMYTKYRLGKMLHGTLLLDKETYKVVNALLDQIRKKCPARYPGFAAPYFTPMDG